MIEIEVLVILLVLPLKKAPSPNGILNKVLKVLTLTIAIGLVYRISLLFIRSQYLVILKESINITL